MNGNDVISAIQAQGYGQTLHQIREALRDGAALMALGFTDKDQEAIECAYAEATERIKHGALLRVTLSDRQRSRTVRAHSGRAAIERVVGARLYRVRHDYTAGCGTIATYQVTVATGPTRNGLTPVKTIWATVSTA